MLDFRVQPAPLRKARPRKPAPTSKKLKVKSEKLKVNGIPKPSFHLYPNFPSS